MCPELWTTKIKHNTRLHDANIISGVAMDNPTKRGNTLPLIRYWTQGPGLARWAATPHPYTALTTALRQEGVPKRMINGLAANYFKLVFGMYPGQRPGIRNKKGKK